MDPAQCNKAVLILDHEELLLILCVAVIRTPVLLGNDDMGYGELVPHLQGSTGRLLPTRHPQAGNKGNFLSFGTWSFCFQGSEAWPGEQQAWKQAHGCIHHPVMGHRNGNCKVLTKEPQGFQSLSVTHGFLFNFPCCAEHPQELREALDTH